MREKNREEKLASMVFFVLLVAGIGTLVLALIPAAYSFLLRFFSYPCLIHEKTGLYCPGCGATRALTALLQGKFLLSLYYHPTVILFTGFFLFYVIRGLVHYISRGKVAFLRLRPVYLYIGLGVTVAQFLIKNICLIFFHLRWMA